MVPIILAAMLSTEPLDCGEALTLTNDTLVTLGYASTEKGDFYFGFDFTAETSYCSPNAPSTEISLGEKTITFKKAETLPHDSLSSCTYVFGRDFFLAHRVDFDRVYRSVSINDDDELETISGSVQLTEGSETVGVEMKGLSDVEGSFPLGVMRHGARFEKRPDAWKTDPRVSGFALTAQNFPVWYSTGPANRFGLTLIPGRTVRFDLGKKRLEWTAGKEAANELIIGEYAGVNEVFRIDSVTLSYYNYDEEAEVEESEDLPFQEVVSLGGIPAIDLLTLLRSSPVEAIVKLRKAASLVYKAKDGTQKTAELDFDPES